MPTPFPPFTLQAVTASFYLRSCWFIMVKFKARERVKRRHAGVVRKFLTIMGVRAEVRLMDG